MDACFPVIVGLLLHAERWIGKPVVGVSTCLLGENVRYNGEIKLDLYLRDVLSASVTFEPVCPETECGMTVPREPMDLFETEAGIRLLTLESGRDMTDVLTGWLVGKLDDLSGKRLCGFVFKARSPSCALKSANVHLDCRTDTDGRGVFARAFTERFPLIPVAEEEDLKDPVIREKFLKNVYKIYENSVLTNKQENASC